MNQYKLIHSNHNIGSLAYETKYDCWQFFILIPRNFSKKDGRTILIQTSLNLIYSN